MSRRILRSLILLNLLLPFSAQAGVNLLDANDWKVVMSGFIETDMVHDSTRSYGEVIGNAPVDPSGSFNAENGRTTFSNRNSRLAFAVLPPLQDDWKTKGYFEFDFMGYEPAVGSGVSEAGFYSNPSIRIRHSYLQAEKNDWSFMVGQYWSLFGWQPTYVPTTVSVAPGSGILYQRTIQAIILKSFKSNDNTLTTGLSIARPSQRDSQMPNVDVGVKYAFGGRRSGFTGATGDANAEPMSIALSGTFRQFAVPQSATDPVGQSKHDAAAGAANILIPIIAADDKDTSHTLTFTGEYTQGTGYADQLSGWSGNLAAFTSTGAGIPGKLNLDAGQAGFDGAGNFTLVNLQTWSAQLQYHFSKESGSFMGVGYGQVHSDNIDTLTASAASGKTLYDTASFYYVNYFKDLTKQIRIGTEYSHAMTKYINDVKPGNDRYQLSAYFRF